ncbi:Zn-dependent membrane protease YugP [Lachnospiraceae bacterium PF1-21]|uniref:Zinc metallopeptidase n=1 Tax=Ohessyouella blattaphilus TaxID=2949333 RepID=A0ABT1EDN3_9FIRM|nr:zinc metallopeptidase [Ohessyouella blattaphilus]MCP1108809.1 zinc metallopeptidase [Ohessyouella blattaphilus]MCR8562203.1 zinc metallopeptidase [Ohessyouella blattaphilus]
MGYGMFFDPTYILVLIGLGLSMLASSKMKSTFAKYSKVRSLTGITGREAAARILQAEGITDVRIEHVSGNLTDHYDPRTKTVRLSDATYNNPSVAAIGVAAHECGHVMQHHQSYAPLKWRTALVPAANLGSNLAWPLIIIGLLINSSSSALLINIGIALFSAAVLFQLVTLPVEFNASSRALEVAGKAGLLNPQEVGQTKEVLQAAAMTYVAAAAGSILQLLRLLILTRGRRD